MNQKKRVPALSLDTGQPLVVFPASYVGHSRRLSCPALSCPLLFVGYFSNFGGFRFRFHSFFFFFFLQFLRGLHVRFRAARAPAAANNTRRPRVPMGEYRAPNLARLLNMLPLLLRESPVFFVMCRLYFVCRYCH